jgi:hypothetical protein
MKQEGKGRWISTYKLITYTNRSAQLNANQPNAISPLLRKTFSPSANRAFHYNSLLLNFFDFIILLTKQNVSMNFSDFIDAPQQHQNTIAD